MTIRLRSDDRTVRPRYSAEAIRAFLPASGAVGGFRFPEPYGTEAARLTNAFDGEIEPVGYSYWSNANAHAGEPNLYVALGRSYGPGLLLSVDKKTLQILSRRDLPIAGTGEGWRFSLTRPFALYVTEGPTLFRLDVRDFSRELVFDLREHGRPNRYLWQSHSSADDRVHSATLREEGTYAVLGAIVYDERTGRVLEVPKRADDFDECQVDKSGRFLLVKEGADVRIVDLETGASTWIADTNGAPGHSDVGFGYVIGEDDRAGVPGAFRLWGPIEAGGRVDFGRIVYHDIEWETLARHVSWTSARPGAVDGQRVLISSAHRREDLPRANELVLATLDGSLEADVLAPNLVDLDAPGGASDYRKLPKANLDPTGAFAVWTANCGGDRLDAFLLRIGPTSSTPGGNVAVPREGPVILPPRRRSWFGALVDAIAGLFRRR